VGWQRCLEQTLCLYVASLLYATSIRGMGSHRQTAGKPKVFREEGPASNERGAPVRRQPLWACILGGRVDDKCLSFVKTVSDCSTDPCAFFCLTERGLRVNEQTTQSCKLKFQSKVLFLIVHLFFCSGWERGRAKNKELCNASSEHSFVRQNETSRSETFRNVHLLPCVALS
jgi:hypothetical protein